MVHVRTSWRDTWKRMARPAAVSGVVLLATAGCGRTEAAPEGSGAAAPAVTSAGTTPGASSEAQARELMKKIADAYRKDGPIAAEISGSLEIKGETPEENRSIAVQATVAVDHAAGHLKFSTTHVFGNSAAGPMTQTVTLVNNSGGLYLLVGVGSAPQYVRMHRLEAIAPAMRDIMMFFEPHMVMPGMIALDPDMLNQLTEEVGTPTVAGAADGGSTLRISGEGRSIELNVTADGLIRSIRSRGEMAGRSVSMKLDVMPTAGAVEATAFAFVPGEAKEVQSLSELMGEGQTYPGDALKGQPAPAIRSVLLDGTPFELAGVKARVVVLDFWSVTCPPCMVGLPQLQALQDWATARKLPVQVVAVNLGDEKGQIEAAKARLKLTLPIVADDGAAGSSYRVQAIPHAVVIVDGKVVSVQIGLPPFMLSEKKAMVERLVARLEKAD